MDVLQELDDKVHSLHDQRMKHLSLERECSRLRQDLDRLAVLQPLLDGEHFNALNARALCFLQCSGIYQADYASCLALMKSALCFCLSICSQLACQMMCNISALMVCITLGFQFDTIQEFLLFANLMLDGSSSVFVTCAPLTDSYCVAKQPGHCTNMILAQNKCNNYGLH